MVIPIFCCFSGYISHAIYNELFLQHCRAFSCTRFVPTFHIRSQYEILFYLSCHTFYKVVIGLFYLCCVSHSSFELPALGCTQLGFCFNFQVSFSYPLPCFFFICCFWHFSYKLTIHYFVFSYFLFFPHLTLFEFLLIHCVLIFCCFCSFRIFNQWLN